MSAQGPQIPSEPTMAGQINGNNVYSSATYLIRPSEAPTVICARAEKKGGCMPSVRGQTSSDHKFAL